jgi:hypothetical protein
VSTDCSEVLLARNRTKRQVKVFMYEAIGNMLEGMAGQTRSENVFGLCCAFLERTGHKLDFLKPSDRLIIKNLRGAISTYR